MALPSGPSSTVKCGPGAESAYVFVIYIDDAPLRSRCFHVVVAFQFLLSYFRSVAPAASNLQFSRMLVRRTFAAVESEELSSPCEQYNLAPLWASAARCLGIDARRVPETEGGPKTGFSAEKAAMGTNRE